MKPNSLEGASARVDFLGIPINPLTMEEVLALLSDRPVDAPFEYIVTPNVDHAVTLLDADKGEDLRSGYASAALRLCDSRILARLAQLKGLSLPVVPGSELTALLFSGVIRPGDSVAIVGGPERTAMILRGRFPGIDFHHHIPPIGLRRNQAAMDEAAAFVRDCRARFTFFAVGSPQQEMLAARVAQSGGAIGVGLCVGAGIDFLTGASRRAPRIVQQLHLEWAHRLLLNPARLWRRYLVEGPRIFLIVARWRGPDRRQ